MKHAAMLFALLFVVAISAIAGEKPIPPPQFIPIQAPGASATYITGINNSGVMVGYYTTPTIHGLVVVVGSKFITLDVPGAKATYCFAINSSGAIVGAYDPQSTEPRGFLYQNGKFTDIGPDHDLAFAYGINDSGEIVGTFSPDGHSNSGFLWDGTSYQMLNVPGSVGFTSATGINNLGQVVLSWADSNGGHGAIYDGTTYTTLDVPGAEGSYPGAINNAGDIAFQWIVRGSIYHAALYHNGQFYKFMVPGSNYTGAIGLNDSDVVVGYSAYVHGGVLGFKLIP